MPTRTLLERLEEGPPLVSDGGTGALLRKQGWEGPTEDASLHAPETVEEIHRRFREAGAEVILTNTFGLSGRPLEDLPALIEAAVKLARRASAGSAYVLGSLGPWKGPPVTAEERRRNAECCGRELLRSGVEGVWLETLPAPDQVDWDAVAALAAAFRGPVLISHAPLWPGPWVESFRAAAVGLNCGEPRELLPLARALASRGSGSPPSKKRVLTLRPSAGLPSGEGRSLRWPVSPAEFGLFAEEALSLGARVIGGCCGATPDHIAAVARVAGQAR